MTGRDWVSTARLGLAGFVLSVSTSSCGPPVDEQELPPGPAQGVDVDEKGRRLVPGIGLVDAPGYELVVTHCVRCHGPRQFLQQRGSPDTWLGLIRWMQKDHNLEALPPETEQGIVAYLAEHYGPEDRGRRPGLAPHLLPPNPYPVSGR